MNQSNVLVFRVDASTQMGTGHLMRCVALAQAWQDQGGEATFLTHCESDRLRERIVEEGFNFVPVEQPHPSPSDLSQTLSVLSALAHSTALAGETGKRSKTTETSKANETSETSETSETNQPSPPWLILDGYHFDAEYQRAVKEAGFRILCIDDMAHLDHYYADIVLNQNLHAQDLRYRCEPYTRLLLGTKYVLLRREFLKWHGWKREIPDVARKVLVTMGGSDPDNVTLKVIRALGQVHVADLEAKVIVGPANPHTEAIRKELSLLPFASELLPSVSDMPASMAWADVAVSGAGCTSWEFLFMRVPLITLVLAENQVSIGRTLQDAGATVNLGEGSVISPTAMAKAIAMVLGDREHRSCMASKGEMRVDGLGTERIAAILESLS